MGPGWSGSFGSSLLCSFSDPGCVCTFSALDMGPDKLISGWAGLGMDVLAVPAVGGGSAGVGRSRQAGGSWCDLKELHLPAGSSGDGAFLLLLSWKTILLYFSKAELSTQLLFRSFHTQTPFISEKL